VLTIAGLGVYLLVHQRSKRREPNETE